MALLLVVIYVPILDPIFHTISLGLLDWVIIIPLAFVPFLAAEGDKFLRLVREKRQNA
jgi:Ca2+-transporting ATPase